MSHADRTVHNVKSSFHSLSHYDSPDDVLNDAELSTDEKRVILSSWASDMYVVESQPALREIPGIPHRIRVDEILSALKKLDDGTDPTPRGGLAMRPPHLDMLEEAISELPQLRIDWQTLRTRHRSIQAFRTSSHRRWTRDENIRRYRKLLNTHLTGLERSFIERRLAEELRG